MTAFTELVWASGNRIHQEKDDGCNCEQYQHERYRPPENVAGHTNSTKQKINLGSASSDASLIGVKSSQPVTLFAH
jgi:hypothetical protein